MVAQTVPALLWLFYQQGFFQQRRSFTDIKSNLAGLGSHPTPQNLNAALSRAKFLTKSGKPGKYRYIQKHAPEAIKVVEEFLPDELIKALTPDFKAELADLRHNYGTSGACTAFLLRKILEKLIFLTFAKNGQESVLFDQNKRLVGLQIMLALASSNRVKGKPFMLQKTVEQIGGIKFLGDTAAHNPLTNVSMKTIIPQMPYIVTAFSELASKL
jgi:hypothetical protein